MENAPRIRVRRAHDRARDQLADLAVLNERLALQSEAEATAARQRVEYLKRRRRNWELVYQTVMREDALCTLAAIEEANSKVEKALSEESRERTGVGKLKRQLQELQAEVAAAHSRLHLTQARVETNLRRINQLKEEAVALTRVPTSDGAEAGVAATAEVSAAGEGVSSAVLPMKRPLKGKGLQSSLDLEDELKNQ